MNGPPHDWLRDRDAVRRRPAMFVGSIETRGLYRTFCQVLDSSMEMAVRGRARRVEVVVHTDLSLSVADDGPGTWEDSGPDDAIPGILPALTDLCAGLPTNDWEPRVSGDWGLTLASVNALAEWLEVTVRWGGTIYHQRFERGLPVAHPPMSGTTSPGETGTRIRWRPDAEIFPVIELRTEAVLNRLRTLPFLSPGTCLTFSDERTGDAWTFEHPGGLADFVALLNTGRVTLHPPISIRHQAESEAIDVGIQYAEGSRHQILSFANHEPTPRGGTHEAGFRAALTRVMNRDAGGQGFLGSGERGFRFEQARRGLCAVVSVRVRRARMEGPTSASASLANEEIQPVVERVVESGLEEYLRQAPTAWAPVWRQCKWDQ
jgi:DNA gyrase subunit B